MEVADKKKAVSEKMGDATCLLLTALDQIAWFMNLRASDIEYNPVFFSYAIFTKESGIVDLFTDKKHFEKPLENVLLHDYNSINDHLKELVSQGAKIGVDKNKCNAELDLIIKDNSVNLDNVVETIKACKTQVE